MRKCRKYSAFRRSLKMMRRLPSSVNGTDGNERKQLLAEASGPVFLGMDAGSTTTKAVLIDREGRILWQFYESNAGNPVNLAVTMLQSLYKQIPSGAHIARSLSTGYGEGLFQAAFGVDTGEVETIAHHRAADFFLPGVDFCSTSADRI